jgi:hypothetical protein
MMHSNYVTVLTETVVRPCDRLTDNFGALTQPARGETSAHGTGPNVGTA